MNNENQLLTKIRFLQSEVTSLTEENIEIRNLLNLNKEVIRTFQNNLQTLEKIPTTAMTSKRHESEILKSTEGNYNERTFQTLFNQLYEENAQLHKLNSMLSKQRDQARSQSLVNEQIAESSQQREIEVLMELEQKVKQYKNRLEEKEQYILELETKLEETSCKKKQYNKQIISPTHSQLLFHQELELLRSYLKKCQDENEILVKEKRDLTAKMTIQKIQLKKSLDLNEPPQNQIQGSFKLFIFQKDNELSNNSGGSLDSSIHDQLPAKIESKISPKDMVQLPKLNIAKAQKIQKLSIKKQEEIDQQEEIKKQEKKFIDDSKQASQKKQVNNNQLKSSQTPAGVNTNALFTSPNKLYLQLQQVQEQNKQVQKDLTQCRLKLQDEMLKNKQLEDQLDRLSRQLEESEHINSLLISSQQKYELKWAKIYDLFHQYYNFFIKNAGNSLEETNSYQIHPLIVSPRSINPSMRQTVKSLLQYMIPTEKVKNQFVSHLFSKSECKQQLCELAYSLYQNHKLEEKLNREILKKMRTRSKSLSFYFQIGNTVIRSKSR